MGWLDFLSRGNSGNGHGRERATDAFGSGKRVYSANTDTALGVAISTLLEKTGANGAAVALAEGKILVCRASAGDVAPDVSVALSADTGITGACVRVAKLLHCRDAELDTRVDAAVCRNLGIRSILVTPIVIDGVVVGIVEAMSVRPNAFESVHVKWLEAVAAWLRDSCCRSDQSAHGPTHQACTQPQPDPDRSPSVKEKHLSSHSGSGAAQPRTNTKPQQQDPGVDSFRESMKHMPVASTWEDIRHELVSRIVA